MSPVRARRAPAGGHEEGNGERWLLTYADMITLLLALFIVLFSFSSISVKKFLELRVGLTAAFNPSAAANSGKGLLDQTSLVSTPGQASSTSPVVANEHGGGQADTGNKTADAESRALADELRHALQRAGLKSDAAVSISSRGVTVQVLADKAFFASDSALLGVAGRRVVDLIAGIVRGYPNALVVEGHTDNVAVSGGPFTSNWELSAVRAANVVERLNRNDGIEASRLSSQGYGDTRPLAANTTAAGRRENRRIDIVVLNGAG